MKKQIAKHVLALSLLVVTARSQALVISPVLEAIIVPGVGTTVQSISLDNLYTSPVVVCTYNLPSAADGEAVIRVNNVAGGGFDIQLQQLDVNPPGNPAVVPNDIYCLIAEETLPGQAPHSLPGGLIFEAHRTVSTTTQGPNSLPGDDFSGLGVNVTADIEGTYTNPAVLGQVMTFNNAGFSTFWSHDCESRVRNAFQVGGPAGTGICVGKHNGQSNLLPNPDSEILGYIVVETATGVNSNVRYQSALGPDSVAGVQGAPPYNYGLNDDYIFGVSTISGMDGGDGGFTVLYGANPFVNGNLGLAVDEESATDNERAHTPEQNAFWVFSESDFGDAPASYNQGDAPEHLIRSGFSVSAADDVFVGAASTSELVEVTDDSDVDDGAIIFPPIEIPNPGDSYIVNVPYTGAARLCGWIDFDINGQAGDGTFDLDERVCVDTTDAICSGAGVSGSCALSFTIPADFIFDGTQETWARFRTSGLTTGSGAVESPIGLTFTGEVEDYRIDPNTLPVTLSYFSSQEFPISLSLEWQTSSETFTAGFNIWGQVNADWVQLNREIIRTTQLDSVLPQNYHTLVSIDNLDGPLTAVAITSVDVNGFEQGFGPFDPGQRYGSESSFAPIQWDSIRREFDQRMAARGYVQVNQKWRKLTPQLSERLARQVGNAEVVAHLGVIDDGMVRVTFEELFSAGIDLSGILKRDLALTYKAQSVSRRVGGPGRHFGPGSFLDFYGEAPKGSDALYIPENVYQLGKDPTKALPVERIRRLPGESPTTYLTTRRVEEDNQYSNILPSGDPFLMAILFAFGGNYATFPALTLPGYGMEVSADIDTTQESRVEVHLGAISNPPAQDLDGDGAVDPDHAVEILVNGHAAVLDNPTLDGFGDWLVTGTLAPGILQPGSNELRIHMLATGYTQTDLIALDGYGVHYPRPLNMVQDKLEIGEINNEANPGAEGYTVNGLTRRTAHVYAFNPSSDDRPGNLVRLKSESSYLGRGLYSASFPTVGDSGARYWVSTAAEFGQASITPSVASSDLLSRQGNYLLIGHASFLPLSGQNAPEDHKLNEYIAAKELEGYTPVVVDIADIVEDFGFGMKTPDALTRYLKAADASFAYDHALLIGGNVNDYLNKVGDPANPPISYIPTRYAVTSERLVYTPTDALIVDFDGDEISDKALGRWPVRTEAELGYIVDKTLAYGDASSGVYQDRTALLIAEEVTPQEGFNFKLQMERINQKLASLNPSDAANPIKWDVTAGAVDKVYLDDIIAENPPGGYLAAAQVQIQDGINQPDGQALTIFGGHGAPMSWSFNNLMTPAIAQNNLTNAGTPTLMMPMACYTTYYSETSTNTLAHQLLLAGDKGAVAIHAAATLSSYQDNERMGTAALESQLIGGQTLGQAIEQARQSVNVRDVQINWTLLGDPTLRLE